MIVARLLVVLLFAAVAGCSAGVSAPQPPSTSAPAADQPRPVRVLVASRGIDGEVLPEGLGLDATGGHVEPPLEKPQLASWYNLGPRPGEPGPSVILGHVNGGGRVGVFANLAEVRPGDVVVVVREDGSRAEFEVSEARVVSKREFPTAAVYGNTEGPELRLITCGGQLDRVRHHYLSNVIVWAKLRGVPV